ncbi:beta-N-acetylhexosaminidase [Albimonas donghaensis]|uniref:beta-N-acetylhexosaminidase n=1 Tax=Albimonas donghaensis TaxID=356660 RepID=A0A1H3EZM1_9RHOB|nr:beta-N-acetylhexosaminidase [Albimonas donghaensis]SDX84045.1 beta-N-acetylhexosaminidase [Albimonas donghaensis]
MAAPHAIILGLDGLRLTEAERAFFAEADPWGFILFARNIADPAQVSALTAELRAAVGREAPIFIDQEGGRVARMRAPHWREWPWPPRLEAALSPEAMDEALALRFRLIAHELRAVGVDGNCMPIADVAFAQTDAIIADRALGHDAATVARRAGLIADALLAGGVLPVIKHLPGHGRADMDSHLALPVVEASLDDLRATDFAAFRPLAGQALGMTAHVVYTALDAEAPATLSPAGIAAIREDIGFDGCLMTDDLSMGALSGTMRGRAEAAIAAGCDLILHCNGDRAEMEGALEGTPRLAGAAEARAAAALAARRAPAPFDVIAADARHAALIAPLGQAADG